MNPLFRRLALVAPFAFVAACGSDEGNDSDSGPCLTTDGNLTIDLTEVSVIEDDAAEGLGIFTNTYTLGPTETPHRFVFEPPCDGALSVAVTMQDGSDLPEDFRAVVSWAPDSRFATDIRIDADNALEVDGNLTFDTVAAEGPYIVYVPQPEAGCFSYRVRLEATCPQPEAEICDDELDNDLDGLIDCDDEDCNLPISDACLVPLECGPAADDDLEDNDTEGTATVIDLVGDASSVGYAEFNALDLWLRNEDDDRDGTSDINEDWYRIDLCENGRMFVELTANEAQPDAPYVIEVNTPDGQQDSRSFYPDRENGRTIRIPFRLGNADPQPVFVRVRHNEENSCSSYDLGVGLTCGDCFGQDALDGEDVQEPNETCLNALQIPDEGEPPFDASLRNEWPPNLEEMDQFRIDRDWYRTELCAGGTLTATALVPDGVEPEYTLAAVLPGPIACEAAPFNDESIGSGSQTVTVTNAGDETEDVYVLLRSEELGACMRYELDWDITCPAP